MQLSVTHELPVTSSPFALLDAPYAAVPRSRATPRFRRPFLAHASLAERFAAVFADPQIGGFLVRLVPLGPLQRGCLGFLMIAVGETAAEGPECFYFLRLVMMRLEVVFCVDALCFVSLSFCTDFW